MNGVSAGRGGGKSCHVAHLENFFAQNPNDLAPDLWIPAQQVEQFSTRNKIQIAILGSLGREAVRLS